MLPKAADQRKQDPPWVRRIEKKLSDHGAQKAFASLVAARCERHVLLYWLSVLESPLSDSSWLNLFGMTRRQFAYMPALLRKCAGKIDTLSNCMFMTLSFLQRESRLRQLRDLPALLRESADLLNAQKGHVGPQMPVMRDATKTWLVGYVEKVTGRFHDTEVSALISAVLDRQLYDVNTHKDWRQKHKKQIESLSSQPEFWRAVCSARFRNVS